MMSAPVGEQSHKPRILLYSLRSIFAGALFRCPHYEFEDMVCQIDSVDVVFPQPSKWFNFRNKTADRISRRTTIALNPGIHKITPKKDYDLFFAICGFPKDLLYLNVIPNWGDHWKTSICLIDEIWASQLSKYECFLKILSKFDYVMLYYSQSVKPVNAAIGEKCHFLPPGIDAIRFCPYPQLPKRVIDVYSIGRRSEVTHQALFKMAREHSFFYVYDSMRADDAVNAKEHRLLLASMIKRSQHYIVNPGLIDKPEIRGNQLEIGNRFFEGAAAGAIMIGEYPRNGEFEKLFDWPDSVIHLPYDSDSIGTVISELNKQPERKATIRRNNVVQALLRHDWVYRWEAILETAGLQPLPELLERKKQLRDLATTVENGDHADSVDRELGYTLERTKIFE
jgi:hypothetical protein